VKRANNLLPAPVAGGPTEEFHTERASASPDLAPDPRAKSLVKSPAKPAAQAAPADLRALQIWFLEVVTDSDSVTSGVAKATGPLGAAGRIDPTAIITDGPELGALARIHLYHYAYHARLVECLADDYPAVQYALGASSFDALCRAYIIAHPSQNPNLIGFGKHFTAFLAKAPWYSPSKRDFLTDLARLEWSLVEVLHAQAAPTFDLAALRAIPADRWGAMRLAPSATVRLLESDWPVNAYFQAWRNGENPTIPRRREWSATAIYRNHGYGIWRMDLVRPMAHVLRELYAGKTLAEAIDSMAATIPDAEAEAQLLMNALMKRFSEWTEGGFFAHIA
jgi:hypothetical protein